MLRGRDFNANFLTRVLLAESGWINGEDYKGYNALSHSKSDHRLIISDAHAARKLIYLPTHITSGFSYLISRFKPPMT